MSSLKTILYFLIIFQNIFHKILFYKVNITTQAQPLTDINVSSLIGGYRPNELQRTITGYSAMQSYARYLVSLREVEDDSEFGYTHFCGGVIIRKDLILTAAHCVMRNQQKRPASSITVVAKTPTRLSKNLNSQILKVKRVIVHQNFSMYHKHYDIALLKLRKSIELDNKWAAAIHLPNGRMTNLTSCTVVGWGKMYAHGPLANEVVYLNVTVHSKELCRNLLIDFGDSKICASDLNDFEKNPCSGDSGGPLICNDILTGIVSYGNEYCFGVPTVFTDVYAYKFWIKRNQAVLCRSKNIFHIIMFMIVAIILN